MPTDSEYLKATLNKRDDSLHQAILCQKSISPGTSKFLVSAFKTISDNKCIRQIISKYSG